MTAAEASDTEAHKLPEAMMSCTHGSAMLVDTTQCQWIPLGFRPRGEPQWMGHMRHSSHLSGALEFTRDPHTQPISREGGEAQ